MKLSIIIPLFNEEKTIIKILRRVSLVKLPLNIKKEIIVVDDGSTDSSMLKVQRLKSKVIKLLSHIKNLGKGAAIITGLKHATGDLIIIQDADLEYDPVDYVKLLDPVLKKKAEIVYGSRLVNYSLRLWGKDKTILPLHLIANKLLTFFLNLLYGSNLTDMETGYKLFTRKALGILTLTSNRFEIEPEITIKSLKAGYDIFEVQINTKPRDYTEGKKIGFSDGVKAIWTILKYKFVN